jgi:hypothetical protein
VSHLGRIKQKFVECYRAYVESTGKAVVITFDTLEVIRGMDLMLTFTQWMKPLPATLFILSGRPVPEGPDGKDPVGEELENSPQPIPVRPIGLGEFDQSSAAEYLDRSRVRPGLEGDERTKLVLLTRGHPLWLALVVSYLDEKGVPEEAELPLADIERDMPYAGEMTLDGERLDEEFKRRLVTPYREADFWHEAVKRLAAVRRGVNEPFWRQLMADRPLPEEIGDAQEAWRRLLATPWVRVRGSGRFVTLHDAMAEELTKRVIPLHQDRLWQLQLWQRAIDIYGEQASDRQVALAALDRRLRLAQDKMLLGEAGGKDQGAFTQEAADLDAHKRDLDQVRTARLFYQLLCDFENGCEVFLDLFGQAEREHDLLFQDLLATTMRRFLPGTVVPSAFDDAIRELISAFRSWLKDDQPQIYRKVGAALADYLITSEQPGAATNLLKEISLDGAGDRELCLWNIRLGNAYLRVPGQVDECQAYFVRAVAVAEQADLDPADRHRLVAEAQKELGFYYRNIGLWRHADEAYERARDALQLTLATRRTDEDRAEMASINTNWAYVKGLSGSYRDGVSLVDSAIAVRARLRRRLQEGISRNVRGEVLRYERQFNSAWQSYAEAERIFEEQQSWPWLGVVSQEQAICLYQAAKSGIDLQRGRDPLEQARELVRMAVEICRDRSIRNYPSALNRAGRIFGETEPDTGLDYLAEGISQARALSDGWFWFANLVEYAELSYRAWVESGDDKYRTGITRYEQYFEQVMSEYKYPDLRGRRDIVHGHVAIRDWRTSGDEAYLTIALASYAQGFGLIAQAGVVGSSGTSVIPEAFSTFGELLRELPDHTQTKWLEELRRAWSGLGPGSTMMLARLEELY